MRGKLVGGMVAAALSSSAGAAPTGQHPVKLVVEQQDERVVISVVGEAPTAFRGAYSLEVSSGTNNRSVQSGRVALTPDRSVTLVHLSLGAAAGQNWAAHLAVKDEAGRPLYEEQAS